MRGTQLHLGVALGVLLALPTVAMAVDAKPTFSKDIAPIFQSRCVSCHEPGSIAPMSLRTYEDSRPWARSIKQRVQTRQMPPWHINRAVGVQKFKNDMSLTDEQVDTIVKWVDAGAPQGNPADMPPARQFGDPNAWTIGTPDIVVKFPKYLVPAASPDLYGDLFADIPGIEQVDVSVSSFDRYNSTAQARLTESRGATYLEDIERALASIEGPAGIDVVIYNAGMDPHQHAGGVHGITTEVLAERERMVFAWAKSHALPVAWVPAGGYLSDEFDLDAVCGLHRLTVEAGLASLAA